MARAVPSEGGRRRRLRLKNLILKEINKKRRGGGRAALCIMTLERMDEDEDEEDEGNEWSKSGKIKEEKARGEGRRGEW